MINLDFYAAVAVYILIVLSVIIIAWLFFGKDKTRELSLDPKFIWFCSICSYTYINTKEDRFSACPRCGSYNKK